MEERRQSARSRLFTFQLLSVGHLVALSVALCVRFATPLFKCSPLGFRFGRHYYYYCEKTGSEALSTKINEIFQYKFITYKRSKWTSKGKWFEARMLWSTAQYTGLSVDCPSSSSSSSFFFLKKRKRSPRPGVTSSLCYRHLLTMFPPKALSTD